MSRHPHADLIKEWAENTSRVVQFRDPRLTSIGWMDCAKTPGWHPDVKYRFKPEPKPDVVRYRFISGMDMTCNSEDDANIKLTFDGETGKLKAAEVIND